MLGSEFYAILKCDISVFYLQEAERARAEGERRRRERGYDRHSRYKDRYRDRYRRV